MGRLTCKPGMGWLLLALGIAMAAWVAPAWAGSMDSTLRPVVWALLKDPSPTIPLPDGRGGTRLVSRTLALAGVSNQLAALSIQKALASGQLSPAREAQAQTLMKTLEALEQSELSRAGLVPAGASLSEAGGRWYEAGWWSSVKSWAQNEYNNLENDYRSAPDWSDGGAVRGGQTVHIPHFGKVIHSLSRVESGLRTAPPEQRGTLYAKEGDLYARIARLVDPPVTFAPVASLTAAQIYRQESPAVVTVMGLNDSGVGELGAGSIITARGDVLTNAHVVLNHETGQPFPHVFVYYKPTRVTGDMRLDLRHRMAARIERYDPKLDLALLRPESSSAAPFLLSIGNSRAIMPGTHVVAIGNPESGGLWSMTQGIISGRIANFDGVAGKNVFQTDAGMNRGNSGGPLIDRQGVLIGINTAIARKSADGLAITNVNFSIQSDVVARWIESSGGWPGGGPLQSPSPAPPVPAPDREVSPPLAVTPPPSPPPAALPGLATQRHAFSTERILESQFREIDRLDKKLQRKADKVLGTGE